MAILFRRFRDWWQPPRRAGDRIEHRQVTFLELFYDLVYVVIIAELSHALSAHLSWKALGEFAFMFVVVWWAWFNGTSYTDLHGQNDIRTRSFTFLQMLSVVAMAVFAHDALGETSVGFALSYAIFQLILTYMWWRTGVYDENHRPLSRPYSFAFLITTILFVASIFISIPLRFYLWGISLFISLLLPLNTLRIGKNDPIAQAEIDIVMDITPSLVERFGLFNIIVLGEIIVGVVVGVTDNHHLTWSLAAQAIIGTLLAIILWWNYFDFVSHRIPTKGVWNVSRWFYLHLPLTMGITVVGASILNIIHHTDGHIDSKATWFLSLALAAVLLSIAGLIQVIQLPDEAHRAGKVGSRTMLISAGMIILLQWISINLLPLLLILLVLAMSPIFFGLLTWLRTIEEQAS
jgi:low temperature requirement protein LtrA